MQHAGSINYGKFHPGKMDTARLRGNGVAGRCVDRSFMIYGTRERIIELSGLQCASVCVMLAVCGGHDYPVCMNCI